MPDDLDRADVGPVRLAWAGTDPDPVARRRAGRELLAALIAEVAPRHGTGVVQRCAHCGGRDHGAPHAVEAPVVVSVTYAGAVVVAAAAHLRDAAAIGVDAERVGGPPPDLGRLFAPDARPDLAGWTRIEAVLKADGRGLRVPPGDVRITSAASGDPAAFVAHVPGRPDPLTVLSPEAGPPVCVVSVALALATARG